MAVIRGSEGWGLQELIDSYNSELMRYHQQAERSGSPAAQPSAGEVTPPRSTIAFDEEHTAANTVPTPQTAAPMQSDEQRWLRELQEGLRELEAGLRELEEGLRELREGERLLEQGRAEYEQSQRRAAQMQGEAQMAAATPAPAPNMPDMMPPTAPNMRPMPSPDVMPRPGTMAPTGILQVYTYTAREAKRVPGAQVTVYQRENGGDLLFAATQTDGNGKTPLIRLPVDGGNDTLAPEAAQYLVRVTAQGYITQDALPVQIYPGVIATLPVEMVPEPTLRPYPQMAGGER